MTDLLTFDAGTLARGWLSAMHATGSDAETPLLYETVKLEVHDNLGVRITATDRYMLVTAWVPLDDTDAPLLDVAPDRELIVADHDGRAKGLLTYAHKLAKAAKKNGTTPPELAIRFGLTADEGDSPGFPGLELEQVALELPGAEAVRMGTVGGDYPDWRPLIAGHKPGKVARTALNPDVIGRISRLGLLHGTFISCEFGAAKSGVRFEPLTPADEFPVVRGVFMPVQLAEAVAA